MQCDALRERANAAAADAKRLEAEAATLRATMAEQRRLQQAGLSVPRRPRTHTLSTRVGLQTTQSKVAADRGALDAAQLKDALEKLADAKVRRPVPARNTRTQRHTGPSAPTRTQTSARTLARTVAHIVQ